MKIVAFADLHESLTARKRVEALIKKTKPDVVVCAGDFTVFEQYLDAMMDWMQKLPIPVLVVHGNHEEPAILRKMCAQRSNLTFIHKKPVMKDGVLFVGYGGGGFSVSDKAFDKYGKDIADKVKKADKVVFVTHGPPQGTKLDKLYGDFVGNKSYTKFIQKHGNIVLAISGHLHENFKKEDRLHKARVVNPGPDGMLLNV